MAKRVQKIEFPGALGHTLAAKLELPAGEPLAYVLFAHCFSCSKDLKAVSRLSRALIERDIAVFRFDFTGLGESEGDFADTNFSSNVQDLAAAAEYMRHALRAPQVLVGHSLGGAAVLAVAANVPEAKAVVTLGAPSETQHLRDKLVAAAPELEAAGQARIQLGGRPFTIRRQLLDDLARPHLDDAIAHLRRPLLVMHSPVDEVVGIEHARHIYEKAKHPKSFVSLDDADHLLLRNPEDASYAGEVLAAWASRYAVKRAHAEWPTAASGEVVVQGGQGLRQRVNASGHTLVGDEPERLGGQDSGPSPYDLLLASLGTCTSMTIRMYADRKGWPLDSVTVRLQHHKIYAHDCRDCETQKGKLDEITRDIELHGNLDTAQRERLLEIADRCPVHRTLHSEIKVRSRLIESSNGD